MILKIKSQKQNHRNCCNCNKYKEFYGVMIG